MTKPTPHPHAELIAEAVFDLTRKIEIFSGKGLTRDFSWLPACLEDVVNDNGEFQFRLAAPVEQKPKIVSSLADDDLYGMGDIDYDSDLTIRRNLADTAAQRAIDDLEVPKEWILENYRRDHFALEGVFGNYLRHLREGKL